MILFNHSIRAWLVKLYGNIMREEAYLVRGAAGAAAVAGGATP